MRTSISMEMDENKEPKWRYRLQLLSERNERVVFSFSMPVWLTVIVAVLLSMAIALFALVVMTSTPLRSYLPGYLDMNKRAVVVATSMRADSLAREGELRNLYIENLKAILLDNQIGTDSIQKYDSAIVRFSDSLKVASELETAFVARYEEQERFGLNALDANKQFSAVSFINMVKGTVMVPEEDEEVDQFAGTRIEVRKDTPVLSPLESTVIFEQYILGQGYIVTLQCANDYVIVVSHLSESMVYEGRQLKAGAVIGHAGSKKIDDNLWVSIRIWHRGKPVDPQSVMQF